MGYRDLDGTSEDSFELGVNGLHGIKKTISNEVALYDPVNGEVALSQIMAVGHVHTVPAGVTIVVQEGWQFQHLGRFEIKGRMDVRGRLVIG